MTLKRVLICSGEPAGVGVELCLRIAQWQTDFERMALILLIDENLLRHRASELGKSFVDFIVINQSVLQHESQLQALQKQAQEQKKLLIYPIKLRAPAIAGELNTENVPYVLEILQKAHQLCIHQLAHAIVTLPIHKGIINAYLQPVDTAPSQPYFQGHTEFFQQANQCEEVVMMLACDRLSIALATTHLPLSQVASHIQKPLLEKKLLIVHQYYLTHQGKTPKIAVLGLNPHAGENGYIGREEVDIIQPVIEKLRQKGLDLSDVMSADTAFLPTPLSTFDCFFGMYHDQVLPIIKHVGFHHTTNITLGLPYTRVSVDHGTALDIAGTNRADDGSLRYSLTYLYHECFA